ncbi:30S ribosomal protein S17 [Chloroflexota bacterium]
MEKKKRNYIGRVLSAKMDKTVLLEVETRRRHPRYKRVITYKRKFKAHDEDNTCSVGDLVQFIETRPLSKEKCWLVTEIKAKGKVVEVKPVEIDAEIEEQ